MQIQEFWVKRNDLRSSRVETRAAKALEDGEVRVAIDKFALTSNNVSYGVSGDSIGYWKYFPADGDWGIVPVWGFANVIESRCPEIPVGERIWGFFPMATHATLKPGKVSPMNFIDFAPHRKPLPGFYNQYYRTAGEPKQMSAFEDERCLLFPLFGTSYVLCDFLADNNFFGADQVLIGSASSKTGFGLAHMLKHDAQFSKHRKRSVGLTSASNVGFVQALKVCDEAVAYADVARLDASIPSVLVDMSGAGGVVAAVHQHFGDQLRYSCLVGATHWDAQRQRGALPGPKPTFFFAPSHIAKREKDWGPGVLFGKAFVAGMQVAAAVKGQIEVRRVRGADGVAEQFSALIDNRVPPSVGLMLSLNA